MKSFRYLGDPLFLAASAMYALNRWELKPHIHNAFLHDYFNDVLLMPCALPPLLLMQRWLGLREHDRVPSAGEIALYWTVWSILFEAIGPHIMRGVTGDPGDAVAYTMGGVAAGLWWHRRKWSGPASSNEL